MRAWRDWTTARMLLLHLGLVVGVVSTTLLGLWQLDAWQDHREDKVAALADADPVPLESVLGPDDAFPAADAGRPVTVTGEWLPEETVVVTDRIQHGDTGRWLVTPLAVCASAPCTAGDSVIPVVLGWSDRPGDLGVPPPTGTADVVARLQPAEQDEATPAGADEGVLSSLRILDFVERLDRDLYSGFVILDEPAALRGDLEAVTPEALPSPPASEGLRNLLYAVQWWVFGVFFVVVWWRWVRDELEVARAEEVAEPRIASEV
jgi:cytochrome oxidase assembly protein ShyY1